MHFQQYKQCYVCKISFPIVVYNSVHISNHNHRSNQAKPKHMECISAWYVLLLMRMSVPKVITLYGARSLLFGRSNRAVTTGPSMRKQRLSDINPRWRDCLSFPPELSASPLYGYLKIHARLLTPAAKHNGLEIGILESRKNMTVSFVTWTLLV